MGRHNLLMEVGVINALYVFILFELLAFMVFIASWFYFQLPISMLYVGAVFILVIPMVRVALKHYEQVDKFMPAQAMNVIINVFTPAFIGLTLWFTF